MLRYGAQGIDMPLQTRPFYIIVEGNKPVRYKRFKSLSKWVSYAQKSLLY